MYCVSPELYREAAFRLCDAVDGGNYYSGSVCFRFEAVDCRLTASLIVYRRPLSLPEGEEHPIRDVIPVWWEFHTTGQTGEVPNDFSFGRLKEYLI